MPPSSESDLVAGFVFAHFSSPLFNFSRARTFTVLGLPLSGFAGISVFARFCVEHHTLCVLEQNITPCSVFVNTFINIFVLTNNFADGIFSFER